MACCACGERQQYLALGGREDGHTSQEVLLQHVATVLEDLLEVGALAEDVDHVPNVIINRRSSNGPARCGFVWSVCWLSNEYQAEAYVFDSLSCLRNPVGPEMLNSSSVLATFFRAPDLVLPGCGSAWTRDVCVCVCVCTKY
jgi:hypothetical protein